MLYRGIVCQSYLPLAAFRVALLEDAILARPLISTEVGSGMSYVNVDQQTRIVVRSASAPALRAVINALHGDPNCAARMELATHALPELLFTGQLMVECYAELYRRRGHRIADGVVRPSIRRQ